MSDNKLKRVLCLFLAMLFIFFELSSAVLAVNENNIKVNNIENNTNTVEQKIDKREGGKEDSTDKEEAKSRIESLKRALEEKLKSEKENKEEKVENTDLNEQDKNIHIITFNSNGGFGEMKSIRVADGETYTLPKGEFKASEGKEFGSWTIEGVEYQEGNTITVLKDLELVANWRDEKSISVNDKNEKKELNDNIEVGKEIILNSVSSGPHDKTQYAKINNFNYTTSRGGHNTIENYSLEVIMDPNVSYISGDYIDLKIGYVDSLGVPRTLYQDGVEIAYVTVDYDYVKSNLGNARPMGGNIANIRIIFNHNINNKTNIKFTISSWISSGVRYTLDYRQARDSFYGDFKVWTSNRPYNKISGPNWNQLVTIYIPFVNTNIYNDKYSDGRYKGSIIFNFQNGGYSGGINDRRNFYNEKFIVEVDSGFDLSSLYPGKVIKSSAYNTLEYDPSGSGYKIQYRYKDDSAEMEIVSVQQGYGNVPSTIVVKPITSILEGAAVRFEINNIAFGNKYVNFSDSEGGIPRYNMKAYDSSLSFFPILSYVTNSVFNHKANFSSDIIPKEIGVVIKTKKKFLNYLDEEIKLNGNEFKFQLTGPDGYMQEVGNDSNGDITFDEIKFKEEGTYRYEIKEIQKFNGNSDNTIAYDRTIIHVTINISKNSNGELNPIISYDNNDGFINQSKIIFEYPVTGLNYSIYTLTALLIILSIGLYTSKSKAKH